MIILLAVYNGSPFLARQLDSILAQQNVQWQLMIRDDASQDETEKIISGFSRHNHRISLLKGSTKNGGAKANFSFLMAEAVQIPHGYFAFSDQDDVWAANKLSEQLEVMRRVEPQCPGMPVLIHSDLEVVDASLHSIAPSLMQYQDIKHEASNPLNVLLAQNFVTGCTMVFNRPLLDIALPIPDEALMHDWWLALCASACGKIEYIDKPLVKYRQHGSNEVGAKGIKSRLNPFRTNWRKHWLKGRNNLLRSMKQAKALADRIREHDPENPHLALVEAYASLLDMSPWQRIRRLHDLGVHAQSKTRQALLLSRLLLTPQDRNG